MNTNEMEHFKNYGIIKNIHVDDNDENITITFDTNGNSNTKITFHAEADCSSQSYYVFVDRNWEKIKQKNLVNIILDECETEELRKMFDVKKIEGECITPHYNRLVFGDGTHLNFLLINDSNGYYDGWTNMTINYVPVNKADNKTKVIIVVGLPASGKTMYAENYSKEHDEQIFIYDDVVSNYANSGFLKSISDHKEKTIIVNDPRFCIANVFNGFIKQIQIYVCDSNISIVMFENNRDQCRQNLKLRETDNQKLQKFMRSLDKFHNYYDQTNETYKRFNQVLLPVYK